jgi:hypothetical protein
VETRNWNISLTVALDGFQNFRRYQQVLHYVGNNFEKQETELNGTVKSVSFVIEEMVSMTDIQLEVLVTD